jgi:DNA-binding NtrC family response regulator
VAAGEIRVLIVNLRAELQNTTQTLVGGLRVSTTIARSPYQALDVARERPMIAIISKSAAEMEGVSFPDLIKAISPGTQVIVIDPAEKSSKAAGQAG